MTTFADRHIRENRAMKTRRAKDLQLARQIREERPMGKMKQHPKYNVLTVRIDDDLADQARRIIANQFNGNASAFIEAALREKLAADAQHHMDEVTRGALRRL